MKKGFTLVELAIVLVIIGLLIGGILVAQSMISTTKVQSFVRMVSQFDVAVNNFKTKYNTVPGDSTAFGCVEAANTCGNGIVEDSAIDASQPGAIAVNFDSEIANFWPNLQETGFTYDKTLSATITGNFLVEGNIVNSPKMPLGNKTGVIVYYNSYDTGNEKNFYWFGNGDGLTPTGQLTSDYVQSMKVTDVMAIDNKIDDGKAIITGGKVFTFYGLNNGCSDLTNYNASVVGEVCDLAIMVDW